MIAILSKLTPTVVALKANMLRSLKQGMHQYYRRHPEDNIRVWPHWFSSTRKKENITLKTKMERNNKVVSRRPTPA